MRVSIIIPALNEAAVIAETLRSAAQLKPHEIIVADGGSIDGTADVCRAFAVKVLSAQRGRATQMNAGAREAQGEVLLFLHADTRLPPAALDDVRAGMARHPEIVGGRFDVRIAGTHWLFNVIGRLISLRSRISGVATGDQGIFVRRDIFFALGGYPEIPLMEDVAFSRALKRCGRLVLLRSCAVTSGRRWEAEGIWRTIFKMWMLKSLYLLGVPPDSLRRYYPDAR